MHIRSAVRSGPKPVLKQGLGMHNHSHAYCMRLDPCCDISTVGDTCDRIVHCGNYLELIMLACSQEVYISIVLV